MAAGSDRLLSRGDVRVEPVGSTMAGSRSALIIATYRYDDPRLKMLQAPQRDADALADVLGDPAIGGFDVRTVVNAGAHDISVSLAEFFSQRRVEDLLLVHFSCHGVKDDSGELFLAASDTRMDLLDATAVPSAFVNKAMSHCRSGCVVLLLDCCYAGAFARGMSRADDVVDVTDRFGGRGRAVITASTALQYAFEGDALASQDLGMPSAFTRALVEGLRTGDADRDSDGLVSLDELYAYVHDEVTRLNPDQTPQKWLSDVAGDLYVARRSTPVTRPSKLPQELLDSMTSLLTWERQSVVPPLRSLLTGAHPGRALAARLALQRLAETDDSMQVRDAAGEALVETRTPVETLPARTEVTEPAAPLRPVPTRPPKEEATTLGAGKLQEPHDPRGTWWRHRPIVLLLAAGVALALLVTFVVTRDREDGGSMSATASSLPMSSLVVGGPRGLEVVDAHDETDREIVPKTVGALMPSISPDRHWIAYLAPVSGVDGLNTPRLVRPDGSENHAVLTGGDSQRCPYTTRVAWNPVRQQLTFVCLDAGSDSLGLFRYALDGGGLTRVLPPRPPSTGGEIKGPPTWNGRNHIVFDAVVKGVRTLFSTDVTSTAPAEPSNVVGSSLSEVFPHASSTGLVFLTTTTDGSTAIDLRVAGEPDHGLQSASASEAYSLGAPSWGPTAGELVWPLWYADHTVLRRGKVTPRHGVVVDMEWSPSFDTPKLAPAW